jgi:hypothetical protein
MLGRERASDETEGEELAGELLVLLRHGAEKKRGAD